MLMSWPLFWPTLWPTFWPSSRSLPWPRPASPARSPAAGPASSGRLGAPVAAALLVLALLGGCASRPVTGGMLERDGPEANPPPNLVLVPDAEPRVEPIRAGGPNKPYDVWGQNYVPLTADVPFRERGLASWYGRKFNGKPTASGELYDMYAMTAAHPTLPIPSYARIRNPANGREVVVRINDRGPFHSSRIVDVSYTAALKLDILRGTRPVELERITFDDIRTGAWQQREPVRPVPVPMAAQLAATTPVAEAAASPPLAADELAPGGVPPAPGPMVTAVVGEAVTAGAGVAGRFWVQLGAFRQHDGAVAFRRQVEAQVEGLTPLLSVVSDAALFKLQAGPYPRREDARDAAARLRAVLQLVPVIVERR